jgi:hypothetical protein
MSPLAKILGGSSPSGPYKSAPMDLPVSIAASAVVARRSSIADGDMRSSNGNPDTGKRGTAVIQRN